MMTLGGALAHDVKNKLHFNDTAFDKENEDFACSV